jgi:hypothetical protein
MANNHMKKFSTSLGIKELQIKTTLRFHLTPSDWLSLRKKTTKNASEDAVRIPYTLFLGI